MMRDTHLAQLRFGLWGRLALALLVVAGVGTNTLLVSSTAMAASRNEVTIKRVYDGTASFSTVSTSDPTSNSGLSQTANAVHTPGLDSGATNDVVRTYDGFGVRVDWDINEASASKARLRVTIPGYAKWKPDASGMFAGCGAGSTITNAADESGQSVLICQLGDQPQGSHGAVRPVAVLGFQPDNTNFNVQAELLTDEDSSGTVTDKLDRELTISEAPAGDWVKASPKSQLIPAGTDTTTEPAGYVVMFPLALLDKTQVSSPPRGSGPMDDSVALSFYDHLFNMPTGARFASDAEVARAFTASSGAAAFSGAACGPYAGGGSFPAGSGTWTCEDVTAATSYKVYRIGVSDYDAFRPAPSTNMNGTANNTHYVLTGQVAVFLPETAVTALQDASATGSVRFQNLVTQSDAGAAVNAATLLPINVHGATTSAEDQTSNNVSSVVLSKDGTDGSSGSGSGADFSHWGAFLTGVSIANQNANGGPHFDSYRLAPFPGQPAVPTFEYQFNGYGQIARGQEAYLTIDLTTSGDSTRTFGQPIHGCMRWDASQVSVEPFAAGTTFPVREETNGAVTGFSTRTPSNSTYDLVAGWSAGSRSVNNYGSPRYIPFDDATIKEFNLGVVVEYAKAASPVDTTSQPTTADPLGDNESWTTRDNRDVTCNNSDADANGWVTAEEMLGNSAFQDPADPTRYTADMVRVRTTGTFPWWEQVPPLNSADNQQRAAGIHLSVHARLGTDYDNVNRNGTELYLLSSRSYGTWDVDGGQDSPTITNCRVVAGSSDSPALATTTTGWCNQGYAKQGEGSSSIGTISGTSWPTTMLDPGGFTSGGLGAAGSSHDTLDTADADSDKLTVVYARPTVHKVNDAGGFDIKDNGQETTFTVDVGVIGSPYEALTNFVLTDDLPDNYIFKGAITEPSSQGASCVWPEVGSIGGVITCRFSRTDHATAEGSLPEALTVDWAGDTIRYRVEITGGSSFPNGYVPIRNGAVATTSQAGAWDPDQGVFLDAVNGVYNFNQSVTSSAYTYLPLAYYAGAILKAVDPEEGQCTTNPSNLSDAEWAARCSLIDLDRHPENGATVDEDGNMTFTLSYVNKSNTRVANIRFVDVLPHNSDDEGEPASDSLDDGVTPGLETNGDARYPGSAFSGKLGFVSTTGATTTYVTADDRDTISRDPNNAITDTTWCNFATGTVAAGPGTDADCPSGAYDVTAVYVAAGGLGPNETATVSLTLDTEQAKCGDIWTNSFGARTVHIGLPIRSNDVSIMAQCPPYSLGNQVWQDSNNNGKIDSGEKPLAGVQMLLFESKDGQPVDQNDDGIIDARDAVDTTTTDENGLYLFSNLQPGDFQVGVAPSNWNSDGPLYSMRSSDPTEEDPNDDVDGNDNGIVQNSMVLSGAVTLGDKAEPTGEDPDNDDNADARSNLTVDFGFHTPNFDLALRKTLAQDQDSTVELGDTVTFDVTVFNQGDVIGSDIEVTDYLPAEMELNDSRWTPGPNRTASIKIPGTLAPGESTMVQIKLKVIEGETRIENFAEISSQRPVDSDGNTIETPTGVPISDVDSVPDAVVANDELIDDEIDKTPATGDEDDHDIAPVSGGGHPYSLGNQVWFDTDNDGRIDSGERPIAGVKVLLFESKGGQPVDRNGDGTVDDEDAVAVTRTNADGLYLFSSLMTGTYQVGIAASNWADGGPLHSMRSSDPTENNPNNDVDGNDNGIPRYSMVISGPVSLANQAEPRGESPNNDDNVDARSNLTLDFGFYTPNFDLALRKTLAQGQDSVVELGETVTFDIRVFNQGEVIARDIQVTDYLPVELELNDSRWTAGPGRTATIQLPGPLAPGESTMVQIKLKVIQSATRVENFAEISSQRPVDSDGNTIETPTGVPISDVDSVPDAVVANDELIDDEIDKTPATGDEDDHDIAPISTGGHPYSLGNQVWFDTDNDGRIDSGEKPIAGVKVLLFESKDGKPVDQNGDGEIDDQDAVAVTTTNADGLYLFSTLMAGDYQVGIAASNWAKGGPLYSMRSSDPTEADPNADVDGNDNGIVKHRMVISGPVTLGQTAEPTGEDPNNDDNADERSNLTIDFGFHLPNFDLALRKTLAQGQESSVEVGDTVTFDIRVFNQGEVIGDDIEVTDYIPAQLELDDSRWQAGPGRTATRTITKRLAPGESTVVQIKLKVIKFAWQIDNFAEISAQRPVDSDGGTIRTPTGEPISDVDSVPDGLVDNDELIDDAIDKTPATGDEDDHDIASITVALTPLAFTGTDALGLGAMGLLLLGGGGALVLLLRRRVALG